MINNPLKYANTLFELAHDNGCIDLISQQIDDLQYLHNKIPVFKMVLVTKRLKNEQKIEILKNTLKNFNSLLIELLILIINDNQINNLSMIINRFKYLSKDSSSSNTIEIISAIKLEQTQIDEISSYLFNQLKNKPKINVVIDPNIIGGIKLRFGNKIFDNSIRYQMNQLKKNLHNM